MIVIDPVTLDDAACTRASPKWVYDRTGTLVEVPPNTLGVTYDPSDLSKAPYALIEPAAINHIRNNTMQGAAVGMPGSAPYFWAYRTVTVGLSAQTVAIGKFQGVDVLEFRLHGVATATSGFQLFLESTSGAPAAAGQEFVFSTYLGIAGGGLSGVTSMAMSLDEYDASGAYLASGGATVSPTEVFRRFSATRTIARATAAFVRPIINIYVLQGQSIDLTLRIGLPQLERDRVTSPIKTSGSAVTRAADIINSTPGLIYSNVPITEPAYDAAATYAKDAAVYDPVTKLVYWSMLDANKGNPLSDPSKWNKRGATNRWAAFDDRNNTQSTSAEELLFVLSPRAIAQGLFLGNVDGSEVRVSIAVPNFGVVYSEARSLVMSTSNSSFFRWGFNRIRRRTSFLSLKLPNFYNGLVTIAIRRPGGVAKCGMCMIGPTVEPGPTLVGLSTEIKDYSTTLFNVDGSSSTIERGYRKLMSLDVVIDTESIEQAEDQMIAWRQKTAVWIGAAGRPDSIICGRYSSFKKVIESYPRSKMALQIEGVLS